MHNRNYLLFFVSAAVCAIGSQGCDQSDDADESDDTDTNTNMDTNTNPDSDTGTDTDADTDTSSGGCDETIDTDSETPGEWVDPNSVLIWQDPPYGKGSCWDTAVEYCEALGNGWRLPNINELRSLIRGCPQNELGGECGLSDPDCLDVSCAEACEPCKPLVGPGLCGCYWDEELNGFCLPSPEYSNGVYWSSSKDTTEGNGGSRWVVDFSRASVDAYSTFSMNRAIRCVRDGK
jgi:hypothetical protein